MLREDRIRIEPTRWPEAKSLTTDVATEISSGGFSELESFASRAFSISPRYLEIHRFFYQPAPSREHLKRTSRPVSAYCARASSPAASSVARAASAARRQ